MVHGAVLHRDSLGILRELMSPPANSGFRQERDCLACEYTLCVWTLETEPVVSGPAYS